MRKKLEWGDYFERSRTLKEQSSSESHLYLFTWCLVKISCQDCIHRVFELFVLFFSPVSTFRCTDQTSKY